MKIGLVLRELHRSENDLARELLQASERHKADHEMYHVARDIAVWSHRHVRVIADVAQGYGEDLDPEPDATPQEEGLARTVREKGSDLLGGAPSPGLALLRDLRTIYTKASGVSVDWEMLAQAAQGVQHTDLFAVAKECHPETLRQARWANAKLKESSTQVLVS